MPNRAGPSTRSKRGMTTSVLPTCTKPLKNTRLHQKPQRGGFFREPALSRPSGRFLCCSISVQLQTSTFEITSIANHLARRARIVLSGGELLLLPLYCFQNTSKIRIAAMWKSLGHLGPYLRASLRPRRKNGASLMTTKFRFVGLQRLQQFLPAARPHRRGYVLKPGKKIQLGTIVARKHQSVWRMPLQKMNQGHRRIRGILDPQSAGSRQFAVASICPTLWVISYNIVGNQPDHPKQQ